ncbi:MAG: 50S ribosomal protein L4 [Patescibacteria group bacterium]
MKAPVYNVQGKEVGEINLSDAIFDARWNADLVTQAVRAQELAIRKPVAHTKMRGEVRGGGKKPWRQKGTGRARHGSTRSPLWVGGGVSHGPRNDKKFEVKINKKMRRAALYSALSKKLKDQELRIVDSLSPKEPKTKELFQTLTGFFGGKIGVPSALIIAGPDSKNIYRASANIPKVKSLDAKSINVKDVIQYKNVLIDKNAIEFIP